MKLLIAPWGNPLGWNEVSYIFDEEKGRKRVDSITTLKALHEKFDHVIILALDSLIDLNGNTKSQLNDLYISHVKNNRESGFKNYESIVSSIEAFIQDSLKQIGIENAHVCVLPAFGSPGGKYNFRGKPEDYVSLGLLEIEKIISEIGEPVDEISLDLSHGINFLTSMTVVLCEMLTDIELIKTRDLDSIDIRYYNSEPYSKEKADNEYRIFTVYKTRKSKIDIPYMKINEENQKLIKFSFEQGSAEEGRNIIEINKEYDDKVVNLLKSLYYPFPLLLEKLSISYSFIKLSIDSLLEIWKRNVKINGNTIERNITINYYKVYAFLITKSLQKIVSNGMNIDSIGMDSGNIYKKVSEIGKTLIDNEIWKVMNAKDKLERCGKEKSLYRDVKIGSANFPGSQRSNVKPDKRIMIAHAGLQNDIVMLHKDGKLEYTIPPEEILEII